MITYEITARVPEVLRKRYEAYMREQHIPDLLATGSFAAASISRSPAGLFRIRYEAHDRAALDRYLTEHAQRLRDHFARTFPEGIDVTREEWEVLQSWNDR
jgi:hypothetical protein